MAKKQKKIRRYYQLIIPGGEFLPNWKDEVLATSKNAAAGVFRKVLIEKGANWFSLKRLMKYIRTEN